MTGLLTDARTLLADWTPPDDEQSGVRDGYLAFLAAHPDGLWRSCTAGHVTASTLVVDRAAERVLLTLHPKVGRWLQTGGHLEPQDVSLRAAALREATEETGIAGLALSAWPARLDRHRGHCRPDLPPHLRPEHLDVQFVAVAPADAVARRSEESDDLRWFTWAQVAALPGTDDATRSLAESARTWVSAG